VQDIDSLPDRALPGWLDLEELRSWPGWMDLAWVVLWILGLAGIVIFERWDAIPFQVLWAAMFGVAVWHGRRRHNASAERTRVSDENERLLVTQRQFLQDASHQLRTPITIALGHSELLARHLADNQDRRDIDVVVGELNRLRLLSERLLMIAASANPDFLQPELIDLTDFTVELLWRWRPTADRHWDVGRLDDATVRADRERLSLAIDALLENAIQHTGRGDTIRLSVVRTGQSDLAGLVVEDTGAGISPTELERIFDRFTTGKQPAGRRGTGLGLALVRAVADGHGGTAAAYSAIGQGSRFELTLPLVASPGAGQPSAETCRSIR
jgi:signal transduction histidine kinase